MIKTELYYLRKTRNTKFKLYSKPLPAQNIDIKIIPREHNDVQKKFKKNESTNNLLNIYTQSRNPELQMKIFTKNDKQPNFDLYNLVLKHGLLPNDKLNPTPPNLYNTTTTTNNNNQLFPIPSNPPFQPPAFYGIDPMLIASQQQFQKLGQKVQMNAPPNLTNLNNSSSQFEHGLIYGTLFPHQQDENDININTSNLFMKNTYGDLSKKNETKVQRNQMLTMNTNQQNTNSNVVSNNVNDSTKK